VGGAQQGPLVIDPAPLDGTAGRLLDAALVCIARVGVSKTTLDEVAREAGCARATLYRYFPGKPALLGALVAREAATLAAALQAASATADSLDDAVTAIVVQGARRLASHPALAFVIAAEPEVLLPHLAFDGADRVLAAGARILAPSLEPFLGIVASERAGEWLARILLSYVSSPTDSVDLSDPVSVRALVSDFVVPGLTSIAEFPQGVAP
jgi:AcrR family transcriptional regulator